jgi:hypothetical protein
MLCWSHKKAKNKKKHKGASPSVALGEEGFKKKLNFFPE